MNKRKKAKGHGSVVFRTEDGSIRNIIATHNLIAYYRCIGFTENEIQRKLEEHANTEIEWQKKFVKGWIA